MSRSVRRTFFAWPVAAGLAALLLNGACAQMAADSGPVSTASVGRSAFAPDASGWSGQSGASGHPQMQAEAIQSAAANFNRCVDSLYPAAAKRGVSRATFQAQTNGLTPELKIMDLMDAQPEFTKAVWEYVDLLVSEDRLRRGREILAEHRAAFDMVERTYGVDRHILTAIWGIESKYSTMGGERPVVRSTATLSCVGRRQDYFRNEFIAALELLERGDVKAEQLKGSWAGAFGPTQFMPTVYRNHAIDGDGDGRRDMINSVPDMLASTANFFKRNGWETGQTWGYEVVVPKNFNYLLADRNRQMTIAEWERFGIRRAGDRPFPRHGDRAYLFVPAGSQGPGFLMMHNFRVIMRYNPAEAYALAIGHLADRLRGGDVFVQAWPRHERVLSLTERAEMQQLLARRGYDAGEPDGRFGAKTRAAIRDYQAAAGLVPDGFATVTVLARLRGQ